MEKVSKYVVVASAIVLFVPLLALVSWYSVNLLLWDEWDYYGMFFTHHNVWQIFDWQHGHHRMGVGGLALWAINSLTHWNMIAVSVVTATTILGSALLMVHLNHKLSRSVSIWDVAIPASMLTLTQMETVLLNPSFVQVIVPSFLMLLYVITLMNKTRFLYQATALALLQFAILFSGYGETFFPILLLAITISLWKPNRVMGYAQALVLLGCAAISSLAFFKGLVDCFTPYLRFDPCAMILYLLNFGAMFSGTSGILGQVIGAVYLLALAGIMIESIISSAKGNQLAFVLMLLSGCVLSYTIDSSIGRIAVASRYMTITGIGFATIYLGLRKNKYVAMVLIALALHGSFKTVQLQETIPAIQTAMKAQDWLECREAVKDLSDCDSVMKVHPDYKATHLEQKMKFLETNNLGFFHK